MKTKLLYLSLIFSAVLSAQNPILEYYGHIYNGDVTDGISTRAYNVVNSAVALDQAGTGSQTWNFDQLSDVGVSFYDHSEPSSGQTGSYPGTTIVLNNITDVNSVMTGSSAFFSNIGTFTGVSSTGLSVNYVTNNANMGTFPLPYGYTHSDTTAGTYSYTTYSGTFTGTITTAVDAYGTLNTNDFGNGAGSDAVTRLKTVQTLNLTYLSIPAGTVVITSYFYYRLADLFPIFSSATTAISVPLLSIDQTNTVNESAFPILLGTPSFNLENQVAIAPNPVGNVLSVHANDNINIRSIEITDANGRMVATASDLHAVDVSHLSKGIYFAKIESDRGNMTKKFIKD